MANLGLIYSTTELIGLIRVRLANILRKSPKWLAVISLGTCLLLFILLDWSLKYLTKIPEKAYFSSSVSLEFFRHSPFLLASLLLFVAVVIFYRASLLGKWQQLQCGNWLRGFVAFLALLIVWPVATHGYNFYFDQAYVADRLLLVALWFLLVWRPVFIFPLLCLLFTLLWQFKFPMYGGSILAHKLQVMNVLTLFSACYLYFVFTGVRRTESFVVITCCLVAGAYWLPALTKIKLGWLAHGDISFIPIAAYTHGWLSFLPISQLVDFANTLSWFDWPFKIFVLVVEGSFIAFLWKRRLAQYLLLGIMFFHLGVFLLMGFFFWTWIALDAALLVLLTLDSRKLQWQIFSPLNLAVSVLLIGFSAYWAKPPALGWFDTRLTYTFDLQATTEDGKLVLLAPTFFAPYEDVFTMAAFSYLIQDHNVLVAPYSVTQSSDIASFLDTTQHADEVFAFEKSHGRNRFKAQPSERFYGFLSAYLSSYNRDPQALIELYSFAPWRQFWSFKGVDRKQLAGQKIVKVAVVAQTNLFDGFNLKVIRQQTLKTINIPENMPALPSGNIE
jgi:hypothetical protein